MYKKANSLFYISIFIITICGSVVADDFSGSVFLHNPYGEHVLPGGGYLVYMYHYETQTWLNPSITDSYGRFAFYKVPNGKYLLQVYEYSENYRKLVWKEDVTSDQLLKPMIVLSSIKIIPKASYNPIQGQQKLYSFSLWLESDSLSSIDSVSYYFDHPSFIKKYQKSNNPQRNFLVSYTGWGCLKMIKITVWRNGESSVIELNHCTSLSANRTKK